ncbi:MAG: class I SAM-dependent methyltransferase, partial [bacterium]|nr:class I SAM-dependent methyltransferase [bacterium]
MSRNLWEYVAETSVDEITAGGWKSSYTGEPIPKQEMDEYGDNILHKLKPLLSKKMRVLEIGVSSGITMYRLAPNVGFYYGTDLSNVIIEKNRQRVKQEGHGNIKLRRMPAHDIHLLEEKDFDLVIINSVIQCFNGHNYLRDILAKVIAAVGQKAAIFLGDIMDQDKKAGLIADMVTFRQHHKPTGKNKDNGKNLKTKTDRSQ